MGAEREGKIHVVEERSEEDEFDDSEKKKKNSNAINVGGAEIDTSAPFHSVKDALSLFGGGIAFSKPHSSSSQAQALQLDKHLILKQTQTLKDLEYTKMILERTLKPSIQNLQAFQQESLPVQVQQSVGQLDKCPSDFILMQLQQAKLNLNNHLAHIRSATLLDSYNTMIEKETNLLENSRQRLSSNLYSLEEKINQTRDKLQDANVKGSSSDHTMNPERELRQLNSETNYRFMKIAAAAKSQVSKAMCEIEQTNSIIKTAENRFIAAKTMKEAAKATEAVALADSRALSSSQISPDDVCQQQNPARITLSLNEYYSLTSSRALRAQELCKEKEKDAMLLVDEAYVSQTEILKRVEQVTNEVENSKDILEEALNRVEAANRGKLDVEETLREWRSENGKKRRSTTKFKNTHQRKVSRILDDVNVPNTMTDDLKPATRPTLSIGQILSRKLLLSEEFGHGARVKPTVSLGQMLGKTNNSNNVHYLSQKRDIRSDHKCLPAKRKKFGFPHLALLVTKQSKKRQASSSRVTMYV